MAALTKHILALLPHEPLKNKKPLTTDDLQRRMPAVGIDSLRQCLSRMKRKGQILWTGGVDGSGYAKKRGEKAGYYLPPLSKPEKPKPPVCTYCKYPIVEYRTIRHSRICRNCNRLLSHLVYARNRVKQAGGLELEVLIRKTVLKSAKERPGKIVSIVAATLKSKGIDINAITRWGGIHAGNKGEIKAKQWTESCRGALTRKPRVADDDLMYCIYCKDEITDWIWRRNQRWPSTCNRCERIMRVVEYARRRLFRDGPAGLRLEIVTRQIVLDAPGKTLDEHFWEALKELKLQNIDISKTTPHRK